MAIGIVGEAFGAVSLILIAVVLGIALAALATSRRARVIAERRRVWTPEEAVAGGRLGDALERSRKLLEGSGIKLSPRELLSIWAVCATLPPLAAAALGASMPVIILALALGAGAPMLYLRVARGRNEKRFEEMLGQAMPLIASNLRGGLALRQAIMPVCRDMDEPIRGEFEILNSDIGRGMPVSDALDKMAERNSSKDLKLFASAVRAQERTGGNLAEVVDSVGSTIRARVEMRHEINAKTSQGRATAIIMVLVPPFMLLTLWSMNEMYAEFYTTPMGWLTIGICAVMEGIGYFFTRKICDIKTD